MIQKKLFKNIELVRNIVKHWDIQNPEYVLEVLKELLRDYDSDFKKNIRARSNNMAKPLEEATMVIIKRFTGLTRGVLFNHLKNHLDFTNLKTVLKKLEADKKIVVVAHMHKANKTTIFRYYIPGDEKS